jgi:uncharacterized protein (DUF302 family)
MAYYFSKVLSRPFDVVIASVTDALQAEGFGVLTEIDVKATFKKKLDLQFRNYRILGACNPPFAHKALSIEDKIGLMLPCNVIIQEIGENMVEVAAIDPIASMQAVDSPGLKEVGQKVSEKLSQVINSLSD